MTRKGVAVTVLAFACVPAGVADNTAVLAQPRPTVGEVLKGATGRYPAPAGGAKEDNVQFLRPPLNPTASDVRDWVNAHNAALLRGIRGRFGEAEIQQFLAAERKRCADGVYCQMTFRQQAIAVLLDGQQ